MDHKFVNIAIESIVLKHIVSILSDGENSFGTTGYDTSYGICIFYLGDNQLKLKRLNVYGIHD